MATPDCTVMEAAELVHRLGFDGIELICQENYRCGVSSRISGTDSAKLGANIRDLGLSIPCLVPYANDFNSLNDVKRQSAIDEMKAALDVASALEAGLIRVLPGNAADHGSRESSYGVMVESLQMLAEEAAARVISLAVENHMRTAVSTAAEMSRLIVAIDHPAARVLYDPANLAIMGERDDKSAFRLQRGVVCHVHINDYKILKKSDEPDAKPDFHGYRQRILGEGQGDWQAWMGWLVDSGYDGFVTAEYGTRWFSDILPPPEVGLAHELWSMRSIVNRDTA